MGDNWLSIIQYHVILCMLFNSISLAIYIITSNVGSFLYLILSTIVDEFSYLTLQTDDLVERFNTFNEEFD